MQRDKNFYKTLEEVQAMLDPKSDGKFVAGRKTQFLECNGKTYMLLTHTYDVKRVYCISDTSQEPHQITYPISLPSDVEVSTTVLKKDAVIYRCHKEEGPTLDAPRFYAESLDYPFKQVATASGSGQLSKFTIQKDLIIVNFSTRWRSQLWGGHDDQFPLSDSNYEHMLCTLCKEKGADGWRAAVLKDQPKAQHEDQHEDHSDDHSDDHSEDHSEDQPPEQLPPGTLFEIALFSSTYVAHEGPAEAASSVPGLLNFYLRF